MNILKTIPFLLLMASCTETQAPDFSIGIDVSRNRWAGGQFIGSPAMDSLNLDFVIYHLYVDGTVAQNAEKITTLADAAAEKGVDVVLNLEIVNFLATCTGADGFDYSDAGHFLHRFVFPDTLLKVVSTRKNIIGLQYDELDHTQTTRTISITLYDPSYSLVPLADPTGMDFREADYAVCMGAKSLVEENTRYGMKYILGEHVWPVLFHSFARAGITPVYKQMKENWSDVYAAIAAGAALQYGTELWACLDFWRFTIFPGHCAEEFAANLRFAYWMGVDRLYAESTSAFPDTSETGALNDNGKALAEFSNRYVPENPRPYSFRDYQPEIAIIRFDDTYWGQGPDTYVSTFDDDWNVNGIIRWDDMLFGARDLKANEASKEWLKAWNTITHGQVREGALSFNAENIYGDMPYRCFAPMNAPVVFDQTVRRPLLRSVKLAFLCGQFIDEMTLKDVAALVRKGMTVVTSPRFAPEGIAAGYEKGTVRYEDGKGAWIVTDNMASPEVKELVAPFIGKDDEITLKFSKGRSAVFKIASDGLTFDSIDLHF